MSFVPAHVARGFDGSTVHGPPAGAASHKRVADQYRHEMRRKRFGSKSKQQMTVSVAGDALWALLDARRRELVAALSTRDEINVSRNADDLDNVSLATERELATAELERKSLLLQQIVDALNRLSVGEFGACIRCGREIAARRLESVPWTPYCFLCQEFEEREQQRRTRTSRSY